jgi:uncharacterized coiled-coil DUF342 family protein
MKFSVFDFLSRHHDRAHASIEELKALVESNGREQSRQHKETQEKLDMISAQAQAMIDEVKNMKSIAQASAAALQQLVGQTATLKQQANELQNKVNAGTSSAEDLAALTQATADLHDTAVQLQAATPANTDASKGADQPQG